MTSYSNKYLYASIEFLNEGQVIESGSPNEIIDNPKETETIKFLERSLK